MFTIVRVKEKDKNMKRFSFVIITLIIPMFTLMVSCRDDEDKDFGTSEYTPAQFVDTWCNISDNGQSKVLTLENTHKVSLVDKFLSEDRLVSEIISGTWMYYANSNILVIQYGSLASSEIYAHHTSSYKVRELKEGKMVLLNQFAGAAETYYRLKDKITVEVGETINNIVKTDNYQISDSSVISVDSSGNVSVIGVGTSYLIVNDEDDSYAIEINVLHQSQIFISWLGQSVEKVLEKYGDPDVMGMIGVNPAILYNNPNNGIAAIQVQFDMTSFEVTRILVKYSDKSVWSDDLNFISSSLNVEGDFYFPDDSMLESPYIISGFESESDYFISYNNQIYFNENKHYSPRKLLEADEIRIK